MESVVFCVSYYTAYWDGEQAFNHIYSIGADYIAKHSYDGMSFSGASLTDWNKKDIMSSAYGSKKAEGLYASEVRVWRV